MVSTNDIAEFECIKIDETNYSFIYSWMRGFIESEINHPHRYLCSLQDVNHFKLISKRLRILRNAGDFDRLMFQIYKLVELYAMEVPINYVTEVDFGLSLNLPPMIQNVETAKQRQFKVDQTLENWRTARECDTFQFDKDGKRVVMQNPSEGITFNKFAYKFGNFEAVGYQSMVGYLTCDKFIDNEDILNNKPPKTTKSPFSPNMAWIECVKFNYTQNDPTLRNTFYLKTSFGDSMIYILDLSESAMVNHEKCYQIIVGNPEIKKLMDDGYKIFISTAFEAGMVLSLKGFASIARQWNHHEISAFPETPNDNAAIWHYDQINQSGLLLNGPSNYVGIDECDYCHCSHTYSEGCVNQNSIDFYYGILLLNEYFSKGGIWDELIVMEKYPNIIAFIAFLCRKENPFGFLSIWSFVANVNKFLNQHISGSNLVEHLECYDIALDLRETDGRYKFNQFSMYQWAALRHEKLLFDQCGFEQPSQDVQLDGVAVLDKFRKTFKAHKQECELKNDTQELKELHHELDGMMNIPSWSITSDFDLIFAKFYREQQLNKFGLFPPVVIVDEDLNIRTDEIDIDIDDKEVNSSPLCFASTRNDNKCSKNCTIFNSRKLNRKFFN